MSAKSYAANTIGEGCELNGIDYHLAQELVSNLKHALKTNDNDKLANLFSFPLRVNEAGKENKVKILYVKNKDEFMKQLAEIMPNNIRNKIMKEDGIFCNYQGAMISNGIIWFNTDNGVAKIFVINE